MIQPGDLVTVRMTGINLAHDCARYVGPFELDRDLVVVEADGAEIVTYAWAVEPNREAA